MRIPLLSMLLCSAVFSLTAAELPFYVGTSGPGALGVLRCSIDSESGRLSEPTVVARAKGASFQALSPDGRVLYSVVESQPGRVGAYRLKDGEAELINEEDSKGAGPCHVWVDGVGRNLLVANYGSGSVACLPIRADGSLAPASSFAQHSGSGPDVNRQTGPHAHGVYVDRADRYVYVPDLGTDDVFIYRLDSGAGKLVPNEPRSGRVRAGGGPRHLALHPGGRFVYVCNEMGLTVTAFEVESESGALKSLQEIPILPEGASRAGVTAAEIFCHPNGRFVYVSSRGHDSITVYRVGEDGRLGWVENVSGVPATPRGFGLSPEGRWLVCAGQKLGTLNAYRVDPETGRLADTRQAVPAASASAILFAR
jgi:6-phosphogluconolactonase